MKSVHSIMAAILFATSVQAVAQEAEPQPQPAELPALVFLQHVDSQSTPAARLAALDQALTMLAQPTPFRGTVLCERAAIYDSLDRETEALAGYEQCRQLRPNDPHVLFALGFSEVVHKKVEQGAQRIIRAIELDPTWASYIDPEDLGTLQRQLSYARAGLLSNRLNDALAKAGWGKENPSAFSAVVELAIRHRLEAGDKAGALELLSTVTAPGPGVEMLVDRRYSAIWPELERWAGEDLLVQRRAVLNGATDTYQTAHSPTARLAYVNALNNTGRVDDAIDELRRWSAETNANTDSFYHVQSIVMLGRLLGEQGRRSEGIALMRAGLLAGDPKDRSTANIVPNLVTQLLLAEDYQGAAAILDRYTPAEAGVEAPAALGYFVALKACAMQGLEDTGSAREAHDRVKTVYRANNSAVQIVTNCVGSQDDQAALWIETVKDEDTRSAALVGLETARYRAAQHLPIKTSAEKALRGIAERTDIRAAFSKFARPLPDRYKAALVNFAGLPAEPVRHNMDGPVA